IRRRVRRSYSERGERGATAVVEPRTPQGAETGRFARSRGSTARTCGESGRGHVGGSDCTQGHEWHCRTVRGRGRRRRPCRTGRRSKTNLKRLHYATVQGVREEQGCKGRVAPGPGCITSLHSVAVLPAYGVQERQERYGSDDQGCPRRLD